MVTTVVNNPGAAAGQCADTVGARFFRANKAGTFAVARGDILVKDASTTPDSYKVPAAGASIAGPFYIATQASATTDLKVSLAAGGWWYLVADNTIEVGDDVMLSTSTASHVMLSTAVTTVALLQGKVGVCQGVVDNFGGGTPTAATAGDLCIVNMNAGYSG